MKLIVKLNATTSLIYLLAAAVTSAFMFTRRSEGQTWVALPLIWLVLFVLPLIFVFAHTRNVLASPSQEPSLRFVFLLNLSGALATTLLFQRFALLGRTADSLASPIFAIVALAVFLVASLSLFLKKPSSLATFAAVLFWPYYFLLALETLDRFFFEPPLYRVLYFLCFISPTLFTFAAATVPYRRTFAHVLAIFAVVVSVPWMYSDELRGSELENVWIIFNIPDKEIGMAPTVHPRISILAVALIVLAFAVAVLRLLPPYWQLRKSQVCDRTWPAYGVSFLVLAIWFSQSVMPYRIPGAVGYADRPILQILHVEKHGLQFHENSFSVSHLNSFTFSGNDRRLFQYRFQQKHAWVEPTPALMQRIGATVHSPDLASSASTPIGPIRAWNADNWYVRVEGSGIRSYTSETGMVPPQEIIALFNNFNAAPRSSETGSELKDVCMGFCYDPLSGMGLLYSNHRCFNDGHGDHCR